jgi:hypothetical protein
MAEELSSSMCVPVRQVFVTKGCIFPAFVRLIALEESIMKFLLTLLCAAFFVSAAHAQECTPPEEVKADMAEMYPDATEVMRDEIDGHLFIAFGADGVPTLLTFAYVNVGGGWCLVDYFEVSRDAVIGEGV